MKTIAVTLVGHKGQASTTLCLLRKIGPLPDGSFRAQSALDVDVVYDDGLGELTYKARTGYEPSALISTSDLGVDNAEGQSLVPLLTHEVEGITQAQIDSGYFDKVPFVVYEVNYNDLTMGHEVRSGGTIGEQRIKFGQVAILEERSLSQQAKQIIGELDSLTCRAKAGSMPVGTGGGVVEERFPCGFNFAALLVSGTVEDVGAETDREFTDSGLIGSGANYFAPGIVVWLTGDNAGQTTEVESFDNATGAVVLQFPTVSPILLGDTFQIRPDCSKNKTGHNSCKGTFWLTEWALHFRGEPAIPVAEAGKLNSPGAALSLNAVSGTGE